ncbi:MAG: hybrid sensor histidine kinase/response regulator [Candidatus Margulisbacteria bacterium]|nr:hybrid sensor histidine kinase/response regulator [Candidatus Margulisiibacteriota bacterium]
MFINLKIIATTEYAFPSLRILVVEDEAPIALDIKRILNNKGHDVDIALNGQSGYEKAIKAKKPEKSFDLILADIKMEKMNGLEMARLIKSKKIDIPIISITANANKIMEDSDNTPVDFISIISKPINELDLLVNIKAAYYQHKSCKLEKEKYALELLNQRKEAFISLGILSSCIAHEINQPLQSIKVNSDSSVYWHNQGKTPSVETMIQQFINISANVERINELRQNMVELIKSQAITKRNLVNINKGIEATINTFFSNKLKKEHINIHLNLDPNLKEILAKEIQIYQIITNLVNNAINALNGLDKTDKNIIINTKQQGKSVILEIEDNGPGISAKEKKDLFSPLDKNNYLIKNGMGLGLFIVGEIIKAYKGTIKIKDNQMGGTTFHIKFKSARSPG